MNTKQRLIRPRMTPSQAVGEFPCCASVRIAAMQGCSMCLFRDAARCGCRVTRWWMTTRYSDVQRQSQVRMRLASLLCVLAGGRQMLHTWRTFVRKESIGKRLVRLQIMRESLVDHGVVAWRMSRCAPLNSSPLPLESCVGISCVLSSCRNPWQWWLWAEASCPLSFAEPVESYTGTQEGTHT